MSYAIEMKQNRTIGQLLASARQQLGLSQRELADLLGVNNAYVALVETDKNVYPTEYVRKLSPLITSKEHQQLIEALQASLASECHMSPADLAKAKEKLKQLKAKLAAEKLKKADRADKERVDKQIKKIEEEAAAKIKQLRSGK
jgi:transcriptional regulator with XRE-family HTH domain